MRYRYKNNVWFLFVKFEGLGHLHLRNSKSRKFSFGNSPHKTFSHCVLLQTLSPDYTCTEHFQVNCLERVKHCLHNYPHVYLSPAPFTRIKAQQTSPPGGIRTNDTLLSRRALNQHDVRAYTQTHRGWSRSDFPSRTLSGSRCLEDLMCVMMSQNVDICTAYDLW